MTRCPIYVRFPFDLKAAENFPAFGHPCPNGPNRLYLSLVLIGLPVVPLHRRKEHTLVLPWPGRAFPKSRCGNRVPLLDSRNITAQQASAFFDVALRHILLFSKSFSLSAMNIGNASNFFGLIPQLLVRLRTIRARLDVESEYKIRVLSFYSSNTPLHPLYSRS
jgi:hypothetical protein